MRQLDRLFREHPQSVGESYTEHLGSAWSFARELGVACLCCLAHGLLPCLFEKTGSEKVARLYERMITHRDKRVPPATAASATGIQHPPKAPVS